MNLIYEVIMTGWKEASKEAKALVRSWNIHTVEE